MPRPQTPPAHGRPEQLSIFATKNHRQRAVFQGREGSLLEDSVTPSHDDTMGCVHTLNPKIIMAGRRNLSYVSVALRNPTMSLQTTSTSLSLTSRSIQLNIRPAVKPQGKSASLLIIVTYSHCRQHPTAPGR